MRNDLKPWNSADNKKSPSAPVGRTPNLEYWNNLDMYQMKDYSTIGELIQLWDCTVCRGGWLTHLSANKNNHIAATTWRRFICKVLSHFIDAAICFPLVVLLFYAISLVSFGSFSRSRTLRNFVGTLAGWFNLVTWKRWDNDSIKVLPQSDNIQSQCQIKG